VFEIILHAYFSLYVRG